MPAKLRVRSVITTIDPDRAGDVVVPDRHCRTSTSTCSTRSCCGRTTASQLPPIGMCEWLDVQPRRIVAETRFARGVPFAEDVFRLYEQGVLRGWSIGFVPRQAKREVRRDGKTGLRVAEWDLLEYSAVPIPENPGALTVAVAEGAGPRPRRCATGWLRPDDRGGSGPRDDVLERVDRACRD